MKTYLLIALAFLLSYRAQAQKHETRINIHLSTIPGVGFVRYDTSGHYGMGLSLWYKPMSGTRNVWPLEIRRYGPVYKELRYDIFIRNNSEKNTRCITNPFIYGYYGSETARFFEYNNQFRKYMGTTVSYKKYSVGAGLNMHYRLSRRQSSNPQAYLFWGFSAGYKDVIETPSYPRQSALDNLALRLNFGLTVSVH